MNVFIRPATLADIRQMAEIAGGPVTAQGLADWMDDGSAHAAWHLVEDGTGLLLGFQRIGRTEALPDVACEIATFLSANAMPPNASARLFDVTAETARRLRYVWISADLAVKNTAARIYYQNRGFRVYAETEARMLMRYDLD